MKIKHLAVCIPVFNQWSLVQAKLLPALVKSRKAIPESYIVDVIFIDNGSDNISQTVIEALDSYSYRLIHCSKKGSYAARNKGMSTSNADLFIFTDSDCVPDDKWLSSLLYAFDESDYQTLLAGDVHIYTDNKVPNTSELYDISAGLPQARYVAKGYAVTANLAIPRPVFEKIGLFDDRRFSGGDADFCGRALRAGFHLKFIPEAIIYHPARKTWAEFATKVKRMKGGQIRAGKLSRRFKYFFITLVPPFWRFSRTLRSDKLKLSEKIRVVWFQFRLWGVELLEMFLLLLGKSPERR